MCIPISRLSSAKIHASSIFKVKGWGGGKNSKPYPPEKTSEIYKFSIKTFLKNWPVSDNFSKLSPLQWVQKLIDAKG